MAPQPAAKGFKPQRTLYKLDFTGTELEGLQATVRSVSMGQLLQLMENADAVSRLQQLDERSDAAAIAARLRELFAPLARVLVEWNLLDDDDQPVPANLEGLLTQDLDFLTKLMTAFGTAMTQAPPPLRASSPSGASSPEEQTAAAALSKSLPS
jgi:hypothetical protein